METPESISSETREKFPIGSFVKLSEKGRMSVPKRWYDRIGKVVGYGMRDWGSCEPLPRRPETILLVVWKGTTRRRICRRHRSDFEPVGAPEVNDPVITDGRTKLAPVLSLQQWLRIQTALVCYTLRIGDEKSLDKSVRRALRDALKQFNNALKRARGQEPLPTAKRESREDAVGGPEC